ncbi:MAG: YggT family protein [Holophagales bacterium]|jgi:YggT family protein|nr:YggT family protein [Holophagales bacterium]
MPLIFYIADWLLTILIYLVLADCVMSWFPDARNRPAVKLIQSITNPLLLPFRVILPSFGGLDLSPFVAILLLSTLQRLLHNLVG